MYVFYDENLTIKATTSSMCKMDKCSVIETTELDALDKRELVGKKLLLGPQAKPKDLKIAVICNWGDRCGIATYTKELVNSLKQKVKEVCLFAEHLKEEAPPEDNVVRCWKRGESMLPALKQVLDWKPDLIHVQHEFGIFPNATHFLKMLEVLESVPYVVTVHSVYEHLDKTVCTSCIKNVIVHSETGQKTLSQLGHTYPTYVIKHGCVTYPDTTKLWNIFQNDYAIIQFGFGFSYKGVDLAINAINHLKISNDKFKNVWYCYLCSENLHLHNVHEDYYSYIKKKVIEHGLENNIVVLRGFLSEKVIGNFLRTAKLAIFPYRNDPNNSVYGASGAVRNAMANGIPIIASHSHLFDDLDGVIPRIDDHISLAKEIDHVFSDHVYRDSLVKRNLDFVQNNNWSITADRHIEVYDEIIRSYNKNGVRVLTYRKF